MRLAEHTGMASVTRANVAEAAKVSVGTVNNAFGTMDALRTEVMRQAVARSIPSIVAEGLAANSEIARGAPPDVKDAALATLTA
jgi:AcrR family transcriptional regulator